jgi:hypothetical protein
MKDQQSHLTVFQHQQSVYLHGTSFAAYIFSFGHSLEPTIFSPKLVLTFAAGKRSPSVVQAFD